MAITKSDIHAAADQLTAAGQKPTLAAVRRAVGGGSFTTISEAMAEWHHANRSSQAAPMRESVPSPLMERMAALATELWSEAMALANQRMQTERNAMEEERQAMETNRREAVELADQLAVEVEQAKTELLNFVQQMEVIQQKLAEEKAENLVAKTQVDSLKAQIDELKKALANAVNDHEAMAMQASVQTTRLEHAETELAALKKALQSEQSACRELGSTLETEKQNHATAQARINGLEQEAADLKRQLSETATERQTLTVQASTQSTRLEHAENALQEAKAEMASARLEARQAIEAAAELRGQLKALEGNAALQGGLAAAEQPKTRSKPQRKTKSGNAEGHG